MDYESKKGALSADKGSEKKPEHHKSDGEHSAHKHIHFHKHPAGVTAHVMHPDGSHEMHHFAHDDHDGMAAMLAEHMAAPAEGGGMEQHEPAGGAPEGGEGEQPQAA